MTNKQLFLTVVTVVATVVSFLFVWGDSFTGFGAAAYVILLGLLWFMWVQAVVQ